ncbi:MAG: glycoside hydrolase family 88 protein [Verrucomicrobia bacterium]|jgi:rhamnogalacturonyl hydrolase YesR|nr:glycoside hydrolase family 88 protein [Verrucomicrobiota bacterium]
MKTSLSSQGLSMLGRVTFRSLKCSLGVSLTLLGLFSAPLHAAQPVEAFADFTTGRWAVPLLLGAAVDATAMPATVPAGPPLSGAIAPPPILATMECVADWQLAHPSKHKPTDWTQGAGYAGFMALAGISESPKYRDAMLAMGAANQWMLGRRKYHADDHTVGQIYCELFLQYRDPKMIAPMRAHFDDILAHPREGSLQFKTPGNQDRWSWCDALFMSPPAWARLAAATGDARYLDFAVTNWWRTSDYLYDQKHCLYFRDSTYFEQREANGEKVFWGRGNGWVMGGLVRMLQYLPNNHPDRARFVKQFQDMAASLLKCQQKDGLWRASLLDPASYPLKETSSSGFYTYALTWGVNQGLLERAQFEPAVRRAWAALVTCVQPDGKLTHVQPIGADPKHFAEDGTEVYGVGAFLLAGSEIYRLAVLTDAKPVRVQVKNPAVFARSTETVAVSTRQLPQAPVVLDGLTSRILDSQVVGEELMFQVDLVSGEVREYLILPRAALPAAPTPLVKTFARFVPERMDDFAWESDRIAHRMYGPALITGEGTISSGVDVWVKRTRNLVLNKWYESKDYHNDHGEGMDCYSVSHGKVPTRGCGGLGIWDGQKLAVSQNFKTQRVIATGPVRSVFELTYESWDAAGRKVSEVKRMSIDANSNFTRAESTFTADGKAPLTVGVGIAKRDERGSLAQVALDLKAGWLTYWEAPTGTNGNTACALVFPTGVKEFTKDEANFLAIASAAPGKPLVYYLGAGWSKSGDFADATAWQKYVTHFAQRLAAPLKVKLHKNFLNSLNTNKLHP